MGDEKDQVDDGWDDEAASTGPGVQTGAPPREGEAAGEGRKRRRRREEWIPEGDERALQALGFVRDVLREMGLDCRARLRKPEEGQDPQEILIDVAGNDSSRVIGKKGQVLAALQFLVQRVVNRPGTERRHVLVDAEGYRARRDEALASMAKKLGQQAVSEGKIITFEPMNPRERRVVHTALAKFEGVITKSEGEGEDRRVQIIPVRRVTPG